MRRYQVIAVPLLMLLSACATSPDVSTAPSNAELALNESIEQLIDHLSSNNTVEELNKGNVVYLKYYEKNNAVNRMQDALIKLCSDRYKAGHSNIHNINLHEYGGDELNIHQATEAAKQWVLRKYPEVDVQGSDVITGQCVSYPGEAQIVDLLYAYQMIVNPAVQLDEIVPVSLIIMKSEYFDSLTEDALANEVESYEQRKLRLNREAALAEEYSQEEKAMQARAIMMEPFVNGRGKQACKTFTTSDTLLKYEIKRQATIVGFIEDNTDSRIQIRISGYDIENKKPQDILLSDDLKYKGSNVVIGNTIWDAPSGWRLCNQ